jgi:hypothetical protein
MPSLPISDFVALHIKNIVKYSARDIRYFSYIFICSYVIYMDCVSMALVNTYSSIYVLQDTGRKGG